MEGNHYLRGKMIEHFEKSRSTNALPLQYRYCVPWSNLTMRVLFVICCEMRIWNVDIKNEDNGSGSRRRDQRKSDKRVL